MSSLETYVMRVKPAIDSFLRQPTKITLTQVEQEIKEFEFGHMRIFQVQILVPLIVKLEELTGESQELRTSLLNCLRYIVSKIYLTDEKGLRSILCVVLQQLRDPNSANIRANLSEEIKLASVLCITESLQRSTSDVVEAFYTKEKAMIIGQILLTLLEIIATDKYRKLIDAALQCLMVVFYVHDEADYADVVLRNQVANTTFIFLPKVVTVLFKTALADEKVGETLRSKSIRALGRIICIMFEETTDEFLKLRYDVKSFQTLFNEVKYDDEHEKLSLMFGCRRPSVAKMEEHLKQLQTDLRSPQWIAATSLRLRPIFVETSILRAHIAVPIREEYAKMCCLLLKYCAHNLKQNFIDILESVLALSEDEEQSIAQLCKCTLSELQELPSCTSIFDEHVELLLDAHLNKWPRILHRCDDMEQFAELLFFKGFLRNLSTDKLQLLLLVPRNLEMFVMCLITALDICTPRELLDEEYSLRLMQEGAARDLLAAHSKFPWRQFKHINSKRTVSAVYDIAVILGSKPTISRLIFDYCLDLIERRSSVINEAILLLTLMTTNEQADARDSRLVLTEVFVNELLSCEHWHLSLQPDVLYRLKVNKITSWFEDHTPGLYESAVEVRTQDCDSDDESEQVTNRVSILDAQFNVLHTCLILDALGHCAKFMGESFEKHIFLSLDQVLLKLASSNTFIHQAATFTFIAMQMALKYEAPSHLIEHSSDYITFHLHALLKRSSESSAAVDILTVVLQYSTRTNLPHIDSIFQTIREECTKSYQTDNIHSYLRVFQAFLQHVNTWRKETTEEVNELPMQVDEHAAEQNVLSFWQTVLKKPPELDAPMDIHTKENEEEDEMSEATNLNTTTETIKAALPRHIEMTKDIVSQVIKFVSSSALTHQIMSLECLATGIPLLSDYENELLPLVHLIWQPLVEKFRVRNALVLNRSFALLLILGAHAKDFILKRSLRDVIPQLKQFLKLAASHSSSENSKAQTQEFKLQLKLLQHLSEFIKCIQLEGKHFHELMSVVSLYLSQAQPKELQTLAMQFYQNLVPYNGPFVYVTLLQRAHLKEYKENVSEIFKAMGLCI